MKDSERGSWSTVASLCLRITGRILYLCPCFVPVGGRAEWIERTNSSVLLDLNCSGTWPVLGSLCVVVRATERKRQVKK